MQIFFTGTNIQVALKYLCEHYMVSNSNLSFNLSRIESTVRSRNYLYTWTKVTKRHCGQRMSDAATAHLRYITN